MLHAFRTVGRDPSRHLRSGRPLTVRSAQQSSFSPVMPEQSRAAVLAGTSEVDERRRTPTDADGRRDPDGPRDDATR